MNQDLLVDQFGPEGEMGLEPRQRAATTGP